MTDWHSPSIILTEYRASFLSAEVLERLNFTLQFYMSSSYISWAACTCEQSYFLTFAVLHLHRMVHGPAGRFSWTSILITPSSPGNGNFMHRFWYAFVTAQQKLRIQLIFDMASFTCAPDGSLWSPLSWRWWDKMGIMWIVRHGSYLSLCSMEWDDWIAIQVYVSFFYVGWSPCSDGVSKFLWPCSCSHILGSYLHHLCLFCACEYMFKHCHCTFWSMAALSAWRSGSIIGSLLPLPQPCG